MELLIDQEGQSWRVCAQAVENAVWKLGFILIRQVGNDSVSVWMQPTLVREKTLVAAFFEISDLHPKRILFSADPMHHLSQMFSEELLAYRTMARLVGAAQNLSWPCGGRAHAVQSDSRVMCQ